MTEIPEHLLKRAQAARDKAAGSSGADASEAGDRIPDAMLDRQKLQVHQVALPSLQPRLLQVFQWAQALVVTRNASSPW